MKFSVAPVLLFPLIVGCSTFRPIPPAGLMWAYFGESQSIPSLRIVVYAPDKPACEVSRVKDMKQLPVSAAWAEMTVPAGECRQVVIGTGADYWVFAYPNFGAMGADHDWCLKIREAAARSSRVWLGECQPVGLKSLP